EEGKGGERGGGEEGRPAPAEGVPRGIAHVADDGLHEQAGERGGEPQHGDLVRVGAEVLVDGAHVGHLQRPAELDAQEAEGHVPDLPEAQVWSRAFAGHLASRGYLMSRTRPSWGPSVSGSHFPGPSLPWTFRGRRSVIVPPAVAGSMSTASRPGGRARLTGVTWRPAPGGRGGTMPASPGACTAGRATCSLSLMRYCARTCSILRSSEANEPGRWSCSGSGP